MTTARAPFAITGIGRNLPSNVVTNEQVTDAYNAYWARRDPRVDRLDPAKIEQRFGIHTRRLVDADGVLDIERMRPRIPRSIGSASFHAAFSMPAIEEALAMAGTRGQDIDLVIHASSGSPRMFPSVGIEIQSLISARGMAFDISMGCGSSLWAIQLATSLMEAGRANRVLIANPAIPSAYWSWTDKFSHLCGDAAAALVIERLDASRSFALEIASTRIVTSYSDSIANDFGYLGQCEDELEPRLTVLHLDSLASDVVAKTVEEGQQHARDLGIPIADLAFLVPHQGTKPIVEPVVARMAQEGLRGRVPLVYPIYGNTSSAGAALALYTIKDEIKRGDTGMLLAFGAGTSIGSVMLKAL